MNENLTDDFIVLHEEKIYKNQIDCAEMIFNNFLTNTGKSQLLITEPQEGKTGVEEYLISKFIEYCEKNKQEYQVVYAIQLSDTGVKNQTKKRLRKSGLLEKVILLHQGDVNVQNYEKKIINDSPSKLTLLINEECHIALGADRPFDYFWQHIGVNYGQDFTKWENNKIWMLSVSATPFPQCIKEKIEDNAFMIVKLKRSANYFGLQSLLDSNRLNDNLLLFKENHLSKELVDVIENYITECETQGNKYAGIRFPNSRGKTGKDINCFTKLLKEKFPNISIEEFSQKQENLNELDDQLSVSPIKPTIILIKQALNAGKTLTTTKHIGLWIEYKGTSSGSDTVAQRVGRFLGYKDDYGHSKFDDKFKVYCSLDDVKLALDFYNNPDKICKGTWNNSSRIFTNDPTYSLIIGETYKFYDEIEKQKRFEDVHYMEYFKNYFENNELDENSAKEKFAKWQTRRVVHLKNNTKNLWADLIRIMDLLHGDLNLPFVGKPLTGFAAQNIYNLEGPFIENTSCVNISSYNELMAKYPIFKNIKSLYFKILDFPKFREFDDYKNKLKNGGILIKSV